MCRRAFGIGAREVAAHVAATNRRYGGAAPAASRVLFVNGDVGESHARPSARARRPCPTLALLRLLTTHAVPTLSAPFTHACNVSTHPTDPWSALGVLVSPDGNRSEPVFLASGASHHAWTHPADRIVQPTVRAAKELVWRQVTHWLHDDDRRQILASAAYSSV
jgi:hypothetical protein